MSNEPLNIGTVKLFINVISDGSGRIEVDEPVGFDALTFVVQQDSKRYGRDVEFSDTDITFHKRDRGFSKLIEIDEIYGFEAQVEFIIQVDGIDFVTGEFEFKDRITDQITYFTAKVLQSSKKAKIKRKNDIKINLFSDKDLEGNTITPVQTHKFLLKAKPVTQVSKWLKSDFAIHTGFSFGTNAMFQNPIRNIESYGIDDTLTFFEAYTVADNTTMANADNFKLIDAQNDLTNNTISFNDIKIKYIVPNGESFENTGSWYFGEVEIKFMVYIGIGTAPNEFTAGYDLDFTYEYVSTYDISGMYGDLTGLVDEYLVTITDVTLDLPNIGRDVSLWGVFNMGRIFTVTDWITGNISISTTATAFDSVIDVVRLIDAQKQVVKSINANQVSAPRFDTGGEHYNNFIFSGKMVRQRTDEPFQITFSDIEKHLPELNFDYQSNENVVDILHYEDFYTNIEIASFGNVPFDTFEETYNNRYLINEVNYKYKGYEQDKDEQNTIDAVHTEAQYLVPNNKVENTKDIDSEFVRDPFKIQFLQDRNVSSDGTTSLSGDDEVFIIEGIEMSPDTDRTETASFYHNIDENNNVELLNNGTFNWTLLGFNVGDSFVINAEENEGNYIVSEYTYNIITLEPIGFTPSFTGHSLTTFTYPITNVLLTNRTNEGFESIIGVENPNNYSNLNYTIRRNLEHWKSYLSTSILYSDKDINNTSFVNNPTLVTTKTGENALEEISGFTNDQLNTAILSAKKLKTTLTGIDFYTHSQIVTGIRDDKGYIRVADNLGRMLKVYPTKIEYTWSTNVLELEGEIKLESQFIEVNKIQNIIDINETGYPDELVYPLQYEAVDNFIQLFDNNSVPLTNKKRYDFVKINGVTYGSIESLTIAINEL